MVRPGFYLGRAYVDRVFLLDFILYNEDIAERDGPAFAETGTVAEDCWPGTQQRVVAVRKARSDRSGGLDGAQVATGRNPRLDGDRTAAGRRARARRRAADRVAGVDASRSEENTSALPSLMRTSYAI